ncbi:hypothetical protein DFJ77DRAFT_441858 [Powellomyces hirtus]|nr:hypothetical protein DFJ77DRAFT_441858 [Powellomyces hirtus]
MAWQIVLEKEAEDVKPKRSAGSDTDDVADRSSELEVAVHRRDQVIGKRQLPPQCKPKRPVESETLPENTDNDTMMLCFRIQGKGSERAAPERLLPVSESKEASADSSPDENTESAQCQKKQNKAHDSNVNDKGAFIATGNRPSLTKVISNQVVERSSPTGENLFLPAMLELAGLCQHDVPVAARQRVKEFRIHMDDNIVPTIAEYSCNIFLRESETLS